MNIREALKNVQRLYIETAPLIYYVEANPTYLAKMDAIIERIEQTPSRNPAILALASWVNIRQ